MGCSGGGLTLKFAINQLILCGTQLERVNPTDCISTTFSALAEFPSHCYYPRFGV